MEGYLCPILNLLLNYFIFYIYDVSFRLKFHFINQMKGLRLSYLTRKDLLMVNRKSYYLYIFLIYISINFDLCNYNLYIHQLNLHIFHLDIRCVYPLNKHLFLLFCNYFYKYRPNIFFLLIFNNYNSNQNIKFIFLHSYHQDIIQVCLYSNMIYNQGNLLFLYSINNSNINKVFLNYNFNHIQ